MSPTFASVPPVRHLWRLGLVAALLCGCGAAPDRVLEEAPIRQARPTAELGPTALADPQTAGDTDSDTDTTSPARPASPALAGDTLVEGTILARRYALRHAIVLHGFVHAGEPKPEAVIFVVSDQPDMCRHLQQGTLPKKSNLLAVTLMNAPDGYAPGQKFLPGGEQGEEELPLASVVLRTLDDRCRILPTLGQHGAEGQYGQATLRSFDAEGGQLDLAFELENDNFAHIGDLRGRAVATPCDAPLLFVNAQQFHTGVVAPQNCL